jgi:acyl dehydratase
MQSLVGQEIGVSDWLEITQDRVNRFADATGDHQWIHVDVERATKELGAPIAHGYLVLSLIPFLAKNIISYQGREPRHQLRLSTRCVSPTWCRWARASACA